METKKAKRILVGEILAEIMLKSREFATMGVSNQNWIKKEGRMAVNLFIITIFKSDYIQSVIKPKTYYNPFHLNIKMMKWREESFPASGLHLYEAMAQFVIFQGQFLLLDMHQLERIKREVPFVVPRYRDVVHNRGPLGTSSFRNSLAVGPIKFFCHDKGIIKIYESLID